MILFYRKSTLLTALVLLILFFSQQALAVCPLCIVTVGAGLGLSRWLGIDDLISGVWIGGLIVAIIIWLLKYLEKKQIRFPFEKIIIPLLFYWGLFLSLWWKGVIGHPENTIYGIDKLLFGVAFGSLIFLAGVLLHNLLKKKNQGNSLFYFQKLVLPIFFLVIVSLIFYLVNNYGKH